MGSNPSSQIPTKIPTTTTTKKKSRNSSGNFSWKKIPTPRLQGGKNFKGKNSKGKNSKGKGPNPSWRGIPREGIPAQSLEFPGKGGSGGSFSSHSSRIRFTSAGLWGERIPGNSWDRGTGISREFGFSGGYVGSRIPRNVGTEIIWNVGAGVSRNGEGRSRFSGGNVGFGIPRNVWDPGFQGKGWSWNWSQNSQECGIGILGDRGDPEFPGNVGSRIPGNVWDLDFQGKGWSWDWRIPRNEGLEFLGNVRSGIPREYLGSWFSREGQREFPGMWDPEFLEIGDLELPGNLGDPNFQKEIWDPEFLGSWEIPVFRGECLGSRFSRLQEFPPLQLCPVPAFLEVLPVQLRNLGKEGMEKGLERAGSIPREFPDFSHFSQIFFPFPPEKQFPEFFPFFHGISRFP